MRKVDSTKKLTMATILIAIATIVVFVNYYFIKPISKLNEKIDVSEEEKIELDFLTSAYLTQNKDTSINENLFHAAINQKYAVAADYYYLKNGKDHLGEYDKILDVAKLIFDDKKIEVSNFTINIDKDRCGKEKYSTIEGFINNEFCDLKETFYEIITTYRQNSKYIVEFYASTAIQEETSSSESCDSFLKPIGYNLKLVDLESEEYYSKVESKCCLEDCALEGVNSFKVNLLSQIKGNNKIYKMTFDKIDDHFVFSKISEI